jgi:hypothetical protein
VKPSFDFELDSTSKFIEAIFWRTKPCSPFKGDSFFSKEHASSNRHEIWGNVLIRNFGSFSEDYKAPYIPEGGVFHNHGKENLDSYINFVYTIPDFKKWNQ